jgi:hypothetical protein
VPTTINLSLTNIIANYSIIQVNITFDASGNSVNGVPFLFSLLADNFYPSNNTTKMITISPNTSFYTASFTMFKNVHYDTSTVYLQFSGQTWGPYPSTLSDRITLGNYQRSFSWELFGLV